MSITGKNTSNSPIVSKQIVILNKLGMHARPAAMFVKITSKFQSDILVEKDGEEVNGKSIMGLMMLAAGCGSKLKVTAQGADAEKAVEEVEALILKKFNEE
jgi:phosphocarrier protein HPr